MLDRIIMILLLLMLFKGMRLFGKKHLNLRWPAG